MYRTLFVMTIVAYRNGILASDTQVSGEDNNHWAYCKKVRKVQGYLLGGCGEIDILTWFLNKFDPIWVKKNTQPLLPANVQTKMEVDFEGLIVAPNRKVYNISETLLITPIRISKYIAIGSGEKLALGAMAVGANAINAVRAAIKHEATCGGRIQYVRL